MTNALRRMANQKLSSALKPKLEREDGARMLFEFLDWLEQDKDLVLCQEFKPKYDWYTRHFADKKGLAREFIAQRNPPGGNLHKATSAISVLYLPRQEKP
jgi:hypothetical protein